MKILIIGKPTNFINQIVSSIGKSHNEYSFSIACDEGNGVNESDTNLYDSIVDCKYSTKSFIFLLKSLLTLTKYLIFSTGLLILDYKQGLKSFKCVFDAFAFIAKSQHANPSSFDCHNIHYITIKRAIISLLLPRESKVIISIWGSDLLRTEGLCYNFWMKSAYNRANTIQLSSAEMRQTLMSKFGFHLKPKIKYALFLPDFNLVDLIDSLRNHQDKIVSFKDKYGINKDHKCITIGNNGNMGNNHIETIKSIERRIKDKAVTILLPLTYALSSEYEDELEMCIKESPLKIICFKAFLSWEELALLRICSDIYITMQITDAMSGTLQEGLFAGNVAISAAWLPYSRFRESGAYFTECQNFHDLGAIVENTIDNFDNYKQRCIDNPKSIKSYFYNHDSLIRDWIDVYSQ